jgi:putative two-component system response regulator
MQKTIFIVDDNITVLAKVEELLERDYLTITFSSAVKMFAVLDKIKPHLILLDIDMPDMNGLEAAKMLKEQDEHRDIPIIFLTGLTDTDTEAYAIELGAADFVTKPFSGPLLLNRIKNHIQTNEIIKDLKEQVRLLKERIEG